MQKNSIIQQDNSYCYVCGKGGNLECHHVFNGTANRKKSDDDGAYIYVHHTCHMWLHNHPISNKTIKARCQKIWQEHYNKTTNDFIKRYGKSYI